MSYQVVSSRESQDVYKRQVSEGSEYLVALYIDKSGRLAATMRINKYLEKSDTLVKDLSLIHI